MTIYQEMLAAGVALYPHESDLYCEDTETSRDILDQFPVQQQLATRFMDQVTHTQWIDIPFVYDPFWEVKLAS